MVFPRKLNRKRNALWRETLPISRRGRLYLYEEDSTYISIKGSTKEARSIAIAATQDFGCPSTVNPRSVMNAAIQASVIFSG